MKTFLIKLTTVLALVLQLAGCGDRFPSWYILEIPQTPEPWVSLLGEPCWRVEWFDSGGRKQMADILPGGSLKIELPASWTNPVTAWPYWPGYNLIPGLFKPAGALFPFDVSGGRLHLSWEGGPDTVFYWELVNANQQNYSRIPANFDWPRFRELFQAETLSEAVREDPWLVDWRFVAERTEANTFDRRRLVPEKTENKTIPVPAGFWYGASPFAKPLFFVAGEPSIFPVRYGDNVWVSEGGILRVNGNVWVFTDREKF